MAEHPAITGEFPKLINGLFADALKTRDREACFLALAAANHHDRQHQTNLGRSVIEQFMLQAGWQLTSVLSAPEKVNTVLACPPLAAAIREVACAIGPKIGTKVMIAELVAEGSRLRYITGNIPGLKEGFGTVYPEYPGPTLAEPYLIVHKGGADRLINFNNALNAVYLPGERNF